MNTYKIMSRGDKCCEDSEQDMEIEQDGNVTSVREVSDGFSLQVTSEQGPECSEGRSQARNRRIGLVGKGKCMYPKAGALWDLRFRISNGSQVGLV